MKKIKGLEIEVSRFVELNNLEVPENIYNGLHKLCEAGLWVDYCDDESMKALEWLEDNIDVVKEIEIEAEYQVKNIS